MPIVHVTVSAAFDGVGDEVTLAKAISAAANLIPHASETSLAGPPARSVVPSSPSADVEVRVHIAGGPAEIQRRLPGAASVKTAWDRKGRDEFRLFFDRAATRVYPPLDTLQYVTTPMRFHMQEAPCGDAERMVQVFVTPTNAFFPLLSLSALSTSHVERVAHRVDGEAAAAVAVQECDVGANPGPPCDTAQGGDGGEFPYDFLTDLEHGPPGTCPGSDPKAVKRVAAARWRVARLITERLFNEASWCVPPTGAGHRGEGGGSAVASCAQQPTYSSVIEAALRMAAETTRGSKCSTGSTRSQTEGRRLLHVDCSGVEVSGCVVARSRRYAYVAVPVGGGAAEAAPHGEGCAGKGNMGTPTPVGGCTPDETYQWVVVSRVPVPLALEHIIAEICERHGDAVSLEVKNLEAEWSKPSARKRPRSGAGDASRATHKAMLSLLANLADVSLHEDTTVVPLPQYLWLPVTLVAHKVHCRYRGRPLAPQEASCPELYVGPLSLSLTLSDTALKSTSGGSPAQCNCLRAAVITATPQLVPNGLEGWRRWLDKSSAAAAGCCLNTFADVVGLVRQSCANFLEKRQLPAMEVACGSRMLRNDGAAGSSKRRAGSIFSPEGDAAVGSGPQQALVDRFFASMTDTMSVYFKKLRGEGGRLPVGVTKLADVEHLEEGPSVEFKGSVASWAHAVAEGGRGGQRVASGSAEPLSKADAWEGGDAQDGVQPGHRSFTTDTERLRHTVAAMASTLGGVILVGVRDDGSIVGVPSGALKALRLTGFCPATVKDAISMRELMVLPGSSPESRQTAHGAERTPSTDLAPRAMPDGWWKKPPSRPPGVATYGGGLASGTSLLACPSTVSTPQALPPQPPVTSATARRTVVIVVSVARGSAPFYSPAKSALPSVRGCASTVPLSALVCARRMLAYLPSFDALL